MAAFAAIEGEVERAKAKAGGKATDSTRRHGEHGERRERQSTATAVTASSPPTPLPHTAGRGEHGNG